MVGGGWTVCPWRGVRIGTALLFKYACVPCGALPPVAVVQQHGSDQLLTKFHALRAPAITIPEYMARYVRVAGSCVAAVEAV